MNNFLKIYFIALPLFLIIDGIWLGFIAKNFYQNHLGFLMKNPINYPVALLVYVLFIAILTIMVIMPALEQRSVYHALIYGALFGLVTYGTYDLTNYATIKDWPLVVTFVDMLWGICITSIVSTSSYFIISHL